MEYLGAIQKSSWLLWVEDLTRPKKSVKLALQTLQYFSMMPYVVCFFHAVTILQYSNIYILIFDMDMIWIWYGFYTILPTDFHRILSGTATPQESLRAWLRKFVSNDIFTWQDLTDEAVYQARASFFSEEKPVEFWLGKSWMYIYIYKYIHIYIFILIFIFTFVFMFITIHLLIYIYIRHSHFSWGVSTLCLPRSALYGLSSRDVFPPGCGRQRVADQSATQGTGGHLDHLESTRPWFNKGYTCVYIV